MAELKLDGSLQKTAFLMDKIPATRANYIHLILSYWQVFDGIDIPEEIVKQIVEKATQPETISRSRRKALQQLRIKQLLEMYRKAKESESAQAPKQ